jgi:hypothetical protein
MTVYSVGIIDQPVADSWNQLGGTMPTLTAKSLNITVALDPAEVAAVPTPPRKPGIGFRMKAPDRTVHALISAKSVRKAQRLIEASEAGGVLLVVRGQLIAGDVVANAGLAALPKAIKPTVSGPSDTAAEATVALLEISSPSP